MEKYYSEKYDFDVYRDKKIPPRRNPDERRPARKRRTTGRRTAPRRAAPQREEIYSDTKRRTVRRPPKKKMSGGKKALVALISVIIIGVIVATAALVSSNMLRDYKKAQPFRFSDNVKVGGVSIGGMSYKDAAEKLKNNRLMMVDSFTVNVTANGEETRFTKHDFEFDMDLKTPLKNAEIYSLKAQGIYEEPKPSEETVPPVETVDDGDIVDFKVEYSVDEDSVRERVAEFGKIVDLDPVNARVTAFHPFAAHRFSYKRGEVGYSLDRDGLSEKILKFLAKGGKEKNIEAYVETIEPEITVEKLKESIVGLAAATSTSYHNKNGNTNMAVALKACNGSIIEPGETWSFNEHTGDSNLESNGYKKAIEIVEGKYVEGVGGGICQASTTIFNAALFANTAIIERNNHFWASDYAFAGEDATIDYPGLDLRFQNTTSYPMFLECKMEGTTLMANIWGVQENYYDTVKIVTENYDVVKKDSYKTRTKRILYKDGKVVSEEEVCYSVYSLKDDHSVRDPDSGTFRTSVKVVKAEPKKKKKQN